MSACVECGVKVTRSKYSGPCATCSAVTCPKHTYFYTDESNIAITNSSQPKCKEHAQ